VCLFLNVVERWKKMFPGYREVIKGRREGQGVGFIGRRRKEESRASTLSSSCYWITIIFSLPQCPPGQASSKIHRSVRVVCQTISGHFDQSEATLARVGRHRAAEDDHDAATLFFLLHQRPSTLPCTIRTRDTHRDGLLTHVLAGVDVLLLLPFQHGPDARWQSPSRRAESRDDTLSGKNSIS
jgi:hypothetical protein